MTACILIVDDRPENLLALTALLEHHEAAIVPARSGTEALELLLTHDVAVALLDVEMPEMDGYELASLMRGSPRTRDIPIIFVTAGGADRQRVVKGYDVGAVDFLIKPIEPLFLESKVRTFLRLHRQAQQLAEAQRQLRAVMDAAPVGISFSHDPHGQKVSHNVAAREQLGLPHRSRFVQGEQPLAAAEEPLHRAIAGNTQVRADELAIERADGRRIPIETIAAPIRDDHGAVAGGVAITLDITERRQLEAALRASERRFRALADAMPQLVWTARADGVVDYYNARTRQYVGIHALADGTWRWQPVLHPDDIEPTLAAWNAAITARSDYACEHRVQTADGSYRWHISRAHLVSDGDGDRWFGTATDIHEQKLAEEQLRRAAASRDQVVSIVAHDLRSPLGVVRMSVPPLRQIVDRSPGEDARRWGQTCLSRLDRQVTKMERLLDELLDVARLQAGQPLDLERRSCDLAALVRVLVEDHAAATTRHTLRLQTTGPAPVGDWDPARIGRVIENLLSNAAKYSPGGSEILVAVEHTGDHGLVRVSDHGVGISPRDRLRIFEWFARGENAARTATGTGIGLAGARQIVEQHGGSLTVESELGVGSMFTVRLPL